MCIGFLDSGVGGVTVLAEAIRRMPEEDFLYYADTLHVPYGEKPKEQVKQFIFDGVESMMEDGIKALVIACNTATSIAARELREAYSIPIIGMEPAVKPAVERNEEKAKRVLVFATSLTLKESKFKELVSAVDRKHIVDYKALPGLVELAESRIYDGPEAEGYLNGVLSELKLEDYGTIVLGCTHFPLFASVFRKLLPAGIELLDGAQGTIRHLKVTLDKKQLSGGGSGKIMFRSSGDTEKDTVSFHSALKQAQVLLKI